MNGEIEVLKIDDFIVKGRLEKPLFIELKKDCDFYKTNIISRNRSKSIDPHDLESSYFWGILTNRKYWEEGKGIAWLKNTGRMFVEREMSHFFNSRFIYTCNDCGYWRRTKGKRNFCPYCLEALTRREPDEELIPDLALYAKEEDDTLELIRVIMDGIKENCLDFTEKEKQILMGMIDIFFEDCLKKQFLLRLNERTGIERKEIKKIVSSLRGKIKHYLSDIEWEDWPMEKRRL